MWKSLAACVYFYLVNLAFHTEGITYLKGVTTPKWTTRMIPLSKWLEDNNWRLAPYGNKEFTKIFRQYKEVIRNKYYEEAPANWTDSSLGKYVKSLFLTSTPGTTKKLLKKDKIKLGKLKLIKENMLKLEERLGITTMSPSTTTEPTTEPYTGPSTRLTLTSFFDPDYIYDPNKILREFKRLKRNVPENICAKEKVSFSKGDSENVLKQIFDSKSNALNIFPSGSLKQEHVLGRESKVWIKTKREEYGVHNYMLKNSRQKKFKRSIDDLKPEKKYCSNEDHILVKRDLGKIARRSTKRPHLSRKFKSQSMKRYREDMRIAQMITDIQSNITIAPEFLMMSDVLADLEKNNLSTLFYVFNNVGYFGSVPPDLLTTKPTVHSTKSNPVTFELGATQVLGSNIFDDEKKRDQKVSPGDVDIPVIDIEQQTHPTEPKNDTIHPNDIEMNKTTKLKRTRKKKTGDTTRGCSNTSKKTRAKRKSTKTVNTLDSLENSLEKDSCSSKVRGKKRKARSLDLSSEDAQCVVEALPTFLSLIYNNNHLRKKRNINNEEETKKIELEEKRKLGHFGKLKESLKKSKSNFIAYVKEKKESLIDIPRRARYIAREMYLDGKFFFQELKEVPGRVKKDYEDKKDMMKLLWDMIKIFMPVTEKGEKGGTTPETKIVEDPKQYVKNPDDYITPDISVLNGQSERIMCSKTIQKTEPTTEKSTTSEKTTASKPKVTEKKTIVTEKTSTQTKATLTEMKTIAFEFKTKHDETTMKTTILVTPTASTSEEESSSVSKSIENKQPVLITDGPSTEKTYITRVVGPDEDTKTTKYNRLEQVIEKVKDDKTFDKLSETMKNKDFMSSIIKNADTDRLRDVMGDMKPTDILSKIDDKTIHKMSKLMTELDTDTIRQMQDLVKKTINVGGSGNKISKTR